VPADPAKSQCSLLLFVATSSEKDALQQAVEARGLPFERITDDRIGRYYWIGKIGDERVIVVRAEGMGPLGRGGSADLALRFRHFTGATAIIQVGMAFGVLPQDGTQVYGDVLVSSSLIPYDNRDIVPHASKPYHVEYGRATRQIASQPLLALFLREKARGNHQFGVHIDALLSGAARIHTRLFRDELIQAVPAGDDPIVGGEMEAVGLLGAGDEPIWCVVKGIVDFADEERDKVFEANRPIACRNAAEFVLAALMNDAHGLASRS
jgi:nucleoside phosphorylase